VHFEFDLINSKLKMNTIQIINSIPSDSLTGDSVTARGFFWDILRLSNKLN